MLHNAKVLYLRSYAVLPFAALLTFALSLSAQSERAALTKALKGSQASAVVLDMRSEKVLAQLGPSRFGAPGSAIKPLLLDYALRHGIVRPGSEVYCRRNLRIGARALPCTHPPDQTVFTAETALAESCNTWFAELGRRFSGQQLEDALQSTGMQHTSAVNDTLEQRQLTVLGLYGVSVTPLQLGRAYRRMVQHLALSDPVFRGLRGSVSYGMANAASVPGLDVLGKTGTASNAGEFWTHGWFAGVLPGRYIVVIYVPRGDGGTASALAKKFFTLVAADGVRR